MKPIKIFYKDVYGFGEALEQEMKERGANPEKMKRVWRTLTHRQLHRALQQGVDVEVNRKRKPGNQNQMNTESRFKRRKTLKDEERKERKDKGAPGKAPKKKWEIVMGFDYFSSLYFYVLVSSLYGLANSYLVSVYSEKLAMISIVLVPIGTVVV